MVDKRMRTYSDAVPDMYPELFTDEKKKCVRTITFQVTDKCNLACTYCYQIHKGEKRMTFETAKKLIDAMVDEDPKLNGYISLDNSPGIIIEFIGGEPFLNIDLIEQICDYFTEKTVSMQHQWALLHKFSISSNGVLYFDEKVQRFLNKYRSWISLSISIDGNKELHDACRIFPDGKPSYDIAVAAAKDWISRGYYMGSKITIAPGNIEHMYDAITHMVELGYNDIMANTVFEEGWNLDHAKIFYRELKRISDYWLDHNIVDTHYLSLFEETYFVPEDASENQNFCGGTGDMLAMDPDGYIYPCLRYMESSLGTDQKPIIIGHIDTGIAITESEKKWVDCLECITRRSQSTDECFNCPISRGCAWCSAYNYQVTGTPNKRVTYICCMHKARALANVYFWNKCYAKNNINKVKKLYCPKEWALEIIDEKEYEMLRSLIERGV